MSTFNDRSGHYSLSMNDPFAPHLTENPHLNMTITLSGPSNKNSMLVTLLRSTMAPLNPENMSIEDKIMFLSQWWWVGFATFPRTILQAAKLFFQKKMPWVSRPEPRRNTISRYADVAEKCMERGFRALLKYRVENLWEHHEKPIALKYMSAGLSGEDDVPVTFCSGYPQEKEIISMEIKILTPTFYSRLAQYTSIRDALISESTSPNCTVSLSDPEDIFQKLLVFKSLSYPQKLTSKYFSCMATEITRSVSEFCLKLSGCLRKHQGYSSDALSINYDKSPLRLSDLDIFMLQHMSSSFQLIIYVFNILRLMMIETIAFGSLIIWDFEVLTVRAFAVWFLVQKISELFMLFSL